MSYLKTVIAFAMVAPSSLAAAANQNPEVLITVRTSQPGSEINRNIYGQFAEHLGRGIYDGIWVGEDSAIPNINGYRKDVVEALRRIHVPILRWPGGCFADQYDWRDGIGPRDKRPVRINYLDGGTLEDNAFGTHEFLNFAELIGAAPYISGNVGSMTPHDMDQWMEYMTSEGRSTLAEERRKNGREKPWNVKYFGIGNEIWGCGGMMRAEYAIDVIRRYAFYLNAPQGQEIVRVAAGPTANFQGYEEFTETMMKNAKTLIGEFGFQALSLHYYTGISADNGGLAFTKVTPATGFDEEKWANYLYSARKMEQFITTISAIMDRYDPERKIALAVDEWGAGHTPERGTDPKYLHQQSSLLDGLVTALTLNIFHRHTERVKMANSSEMVNVLQAIILTNKEKMLLTPPYHVFDMYQPFQGATPYPSEVSGPSYDFESRSLPLVDVSAAKGKDGKLYLALVNLNPHQAVNVVTNLKGRARGAVLTGPDMDTHNTFESPATLIPKSFLGRASSSGRVELELPAKSVVVVRID